MDSLYTKQIPVFPSRIYFNTYHARFSKIFIIYEGIAFINSLKTLGGSSMKRVQD